MAEVSYAVTEIKSRDDHGHIIVWTPLTLSDTGQRLEMIGSSRRTIQLSGTLGTNGCLEIQGSNDGTNWGVLRDKYGNNIRFNGTGIAEIGVLPRYLRPEVVSGDGATSLTATLLVVKENRR